eukprot:TRINITY_DN31032_c0_g1_i1.p1 TRINITY_DN31032_c0_g1~~TRINITY_DN31032_c0_g1_i1.p1  ORF type:complete len:442 (+),score=149.82 TRINITY_DN31032_c0_g1_i1:216-1541(+)
MENKIQYVIPLGKDKPKNVSLVPTDPGSRYKCRQLQVQVIGKSKMIKTVLVNILDVAKDMQVPPAYVGVYMGYDIGAQAKFDPKKPERQQAFLSGEHASADLGRIMQQFVQEFVLCSVCGLPELLITIEKNAHVMQTCRACGHHGEMNIVNEKFKRHVINHPPTTKGFGGNKAGAKKETKTRKERDDEKERESEEPSTTKSKSKKRESDSDDSEDDIEWFSDTSKEAQQKRREAMLPDAVAAIVKADSAPDGAAASPAKKAAADAPASPKLEKKASSDSVETATPNELLDVAAALRGAAKGTEVETLQKLKKAHGVSDKAFVPLLFDALFPAGTKLKDQATSKKAILSKFVVAADSQKALLDSIERFYGVTNPDQLDQATFTIKELYDIDLLDEDAIVSWHESSGENAQPKVRKQVAPLVAWLQEDDDSDEEEEDDEEDDD